MMKHLRGFAAVALSIFFSAFPLWAAEKPFRILISNDDGIMSKGILPLAEALEEIGSITVCAPLENQSAMGHALLTDGPVMVEKIKQKGKFFGYGIKGTPATSVKVGINSGLLSEKPDLVVSGINEGLNIGCSLYVSGTFNAAQEGLLNGIPAIAVSIDRGKNMDYKAAAEFTRDLIKALKTKGFLKDAVININFPACPRKDLKGVLVTCLSDFQYREQWIKRKTPWGKTYFWNTVKRPDTRPAKGSDFWAVEENYVSITPVPFFTRVPLKQIKQIETVSLDFDGKKLQLAPGLAVNKLGAQNHSSSGASK